MTAVIKPKQKRKKNSRKRKRAQVRLVYVAVDRTIDLIPKVKWS